MAWISNNLVGIIGIIVGGFIAYHVYFLSKKLDLRDRLSHKEQIRKSVDVLLSKIAQGINRDVELVNSKKYETHYPNNNKLDQDGYTYLKAELKALRFDGVEFFAEMPKSAYQHSGGFLSLSKESEDQQQALLIYPVGVIPYEWIEYIDMRGDEFSYRPQFFTKFKGLKKFPYKYITYYRKSNVYHKGSDPIDME